MGLMGQLKAKNEDEDEDVDSDTQMMMMMTMGWVGMGTWDGVLGWGLEIG